MTGLILFLSIAALLTLALEITHRRSAGGWTPGRDARNDRDVARLADLDAFQPEDFRAAGFVEADRFFQGVLLFMVFIGFCGLLLQICVQVHAWKQRNAQSAALQRKLERDEAFHRERMKALEMGRHMAMDSTLEAFNNEAG